MFFLQALEHITNGYDVLLAVVSVLGPILATVVTYLLTRRDNAKTRVAAEVAASETVSQTPKLEKIHVLVNGRLSAALEEVESLKAKVAALETGGTA